MYKRFNLSNKNKQKLLKQLKEFLKKKKEIQFAYLFGSFKEENTFRDIDVAVYLTHLKDLAIDYELELEVLLQNKFNYPFDVRILNRAPLSFCYEVIKSGILLFSSNDEIRAEFEEYVILMYLDFAYYQKNYLYEVLGA
ncbi:MAG: nucleotidyltransferase domain-containing protein [Candidatus Desulfofervidus auxilii]|nr:nucleotidyltransferase domain-containing protein [Candidatus Desulfofervidus auxilii]